MTKHNTFYTMKNPLTFFNRNGECTQLKLENEQLKTSIEKASTFIRKIEDGDLNAEYEQHEGGEDALGETLTSMRDRMKDIAEKERERNWVNEGMAKFVEILRSNNQNIEALGNSILASLVKYMKVNQGSLFIVNDDQKDLHLEMIACYAYDRKKFRSKTIQPGEGLVGQCFFEKETIYLTEVPQNYISITSGLGEALPRNIILVPLKMNESIFGIVELASFHKIAPYQIEFLEKLGESIASTIANTKINERTKRLLDDSQMQTEMLKSQEEEMRQNLEELTATQEHHARIQQELVKSQSEMERKVEQMNRYMNVLASLKRDKTVASGNLELAFQTITESLANTVGVTRASIWSFDGAERSITLLDLFEKADHKHSAGAVFQLDPFPGYLKALQNEELMICKDAQTHPSTRDFTEVYLKPLDIRSMLDVPYYIDGKLGGVICFEHQFEQKEWTTEDIMFTSSVADIITTAMLIAENKQFKGEGRNASQAA